jgi:SAM-dependent methyltransferase
VISCSELLAEAVSRPLSGWDFSWLGDRLRTDPLPWDFGTIVSLLAADSPDLLDLGTGGGEFLASLALRAPRTVATEAWPPNVEVARRALAPLGVEVIQVEPALDNVDQEPGEQRGRLPFAPASFSLVTSRHEAYLAAEVARVLSPGGVFATQQLGGDYRDAHEALGLPPPPRRVFDLAFARAQLARAGLEVRDAGEGVTATAFADVGAFAWWLKAAPWVVPGFSIPAHVERLERAHKRIGREGPLVVRDHVFWLQAARPGT